jgi:predicted glycosyltransferase involved in capsule biosynthesis
MSYKEEEVGSRAQYKSFLILGTNILTIISALVLLYVAYLNKKERSITPSDIINPLL